VIDVIVYIIYIIYIELFCSISAWLTTFLTFPLIPVFHNNRILINFLKLNYNHLLVILRLMSVKIFLKKNKKKKKKKKKKVYFKFKFIIDNK